MNDINTVDLFAVELEARRLRAKAFAEMMRGLGRLVMRAVAALRGAGRVRTA